MTHDPTRDCEHGRLKGKCDVCDLQAEAVMQSLQCAHCHVTIETLNDKAVYLIAEVERLKCVNAELEEELRAARHIIVEDGTLIGWRLSEVISEATGETK